MIKMAIDKYTDYINEKDLIVYGGSHGGFLVAHLIGDPEICSQISKGIILNGVLIPITAYTTNILDWNFAAFPTDQWDL